MLRDLKKGVRELARLRQIADILFKYELGFFLEKIGLKRHLPLHKRLQVKKFKKRETQPEKIRLIMDELGGAFVKLGQLLSLRPDLIPNQFCDEFRKLQDEVKPFSYREVEEIIEFELKRPLRKIFPHFEKRPIASASIAQVHRATLKDKTTVAVKVQRPRIKKDIEADIELIEYLARKIKAYYNLKVFDPVDIVEEFKRYTEEELDFVREAKNIDAFHNNFRNFKNTLIPKSYWDYTTERVLTMEFMDGEKLSDVNLKMKSHVTRKLLAHRIVNSVFKQVFIDGFFHADPHPGNILVLDKNRIAFLDFGIVGFFDEEQKEKVTKLFVSTILGNTDGFCESLINLGFSTGFVDKEKLKEDVTFELSKYYNTPLKEYSLAGLFWPLLTLAKNNNIKLPSNLILLTKSVVTVESVAVSLDPDFNLVKEAKPFILQLEKRMRSPKQFLKRVFSTSTSFRDFITNVPKQATELITGIREGEMIAKSIQDDLETLTMEMDKSSNRIAYALLLTAFLLSSSYLMNYSQPLLLGFPILSGIGFVISGVVLGMLLFSISKEKKY